MALWKSSILALGLTTMVGEAFALSASFVRALEEEGIMYVATRRADGSQSTAVPVWFWWDGQHLYSTAAAGSWKAKRIPKGSPVYISFDGAEGPFVEGQTEVVADPELVTRMGEAYNEKYWIAWLGFFRPRASRVESGLTLAYKVTFPKE